VHAIEAASPLPAPPNPAIFTHRVLLQFRATAYSPGAPGELYEPPAALSASDRAQQSEKNSQKAFQTLREAARAPHSRTVIELRIEGSSAEVEPQHQ
jgi:predicted small lipoprotein YifL